MKKLIVKTFFSVTLTVFCHSIAFTQVSTLGNFSADQADFVGWDNNVSFELSVRHDGFRPIIFSTNGNERMRVLRYGNIGVGTGTAEVRPKMMSFLDNSNASLLESSFFQSVSIFGHNRYSTIGEEDMEHIAIQALCDGDNQPEGHRNTAGDFVARYAFQNVGVEAYVGGNPMNEELVGRNGWGIRSIATDHDASNIAISGRATPSPTNLSGYTVGVLGEVGGAGTNEWGGYFVGRTWCSLGVWSGSDESFKQDIEPIENALDVISQINAKSYSYQGEGYPFMHFPEGTHYGLIAQELEEVLPGLVAEVSRPNLLDDPNDEGVTSFKGVNYTGLIPFLVAGMQEQQEIIESQNAVLAEVLDQLSALQEQVSGCCNGVEGAKSQGHGGLMYPMDEGNKESGNILRQNTPNPFSAHTTIRYTLEQGGRVMLKIHDGNGREVTQLENAEQTAGTYTYVWDAAGLPAGLYHYTLFVDDELLVKRAIKLHD